MAWVLLAVGVVLAIFAQPVFAGLALLGAIASSAAALDGATRIRWVTLAVCLLTLAGLVIGSAAPGLL
jgi:hypothetical protein